MPIDPKKIVWDTPSKEGVTWDEAPVSPEGGIMASQGTGFLDAISISAGRAASKILKGYKQAGHAAVKTAINNPLDPYSIAAQQSLANMEKERKDENARFVGIDKEQPVASILGGVAPYAAIPQSAGPLAAGGMAAILGASEYGSPKERLVNSVLSGTGEALGNKVGGMIGSAIDPVIPHLVNESRKTALAGVERYGVRPRLSQITGGPTARQFEDFAAVVPGGSKTMAEFQSVNREGLNKAAAESIGQNANELTPAVMATAKRQMGKVFEDIKSLPSVTVKGVQVPPIQVGGPLEAAAQEVIRIQNKLSAKSRNADVRALADDALKAAQSNGRIDGESYQLIRSDLSNRAYSAYASGDATSGKAFDSLLTALDNSAETSLRSIGKSDLAEALRLVRPKYANYKALTKGKTVTVGDVNPDTLATVLRNKYGDQFSTGAMQGNPLYDVARYGEAFPTLKPGSQTFARGVAGSPIAATVMSPFAYTIAKATTHPAALAYPKYIGGTQAAKIASALSKPITSAGTLGVWDRYFGFLNPQE